MHTTISAVDLKKKIDAGQGDFILVDTMMRESYDTRHIPTAISLAEGADFVPNFEAATNATKDAEIIVYCSSPTCSRHARAADALQAAGYTNVVRFSEGLEGWENAGFAFEPKAERVSD